MNLQFGQQPFVILKFTAALAPLLDLWSSVILEFAFTLAPIVGPPPNLFWSIGEQTNRDGIFTVLRLNLES